MRVLVSSSIGYNHSHCHCNALLSPVMLIQCLMCPETHTWLGYWGAHMKTEEFRALKEYQKVLSLVYFTNLTLGC